MQTTTPSSENIAPRAPAYGGLGVTADFRSRPLSFLMDANAREDVVRLRLWFPPFIGHVARHPDHVRHVLVDNAPNYGKQTRGYARLRELLGNGLVTSEGSFWKRQRRIANPAFHHERLAQFAGTMVSCTEDMLESWGPALASGDPLDVSQEMSRLALRIIGLTMLSADVGAANASAVGEALDHVLHITLNRTLGPSVPLLVPTPQNLRFRRACSAIEDVIGDVIAARRAAGLDHADDLLGMLMSARDPETGEGMSDEQLRDEAMTVFLAGHETTANALSWTLYLLARHPEVEARLRAELATALHGQPPQLGDLPKLPFLERVLKESMRLYPPIWIIARSVIGDDLMGGFRIPAGSLLFLSPFAIHRDPRFWPDPERFDPDRFLPEAEAARPKAAYFPFSLGPRKCIGEGFAMLEARLVLALVLQRTQLSLAKSEPVLPDPTITLRPKGGVWMRARAV